MEGSKSAAGVDILGGMYNAGCRWTTFADTSKAFLMMWNGVLKVGYFKAIYLLRV
jgi:hypothetical protein